MKFRIKEGFGNHREGSEIYGPGAVIETDKNLVNLFGAKFEKVSDSSSITEPIQTPYKKPQTTTTPEPPVVEDSGHGDDVTTLFNAPEGFAVYKGSREQGYTVIADDGEVANADKLSNKKNVQEFLNEMFD